MVILSGSSNLSLATKVAAELSANLVEREISKFPNGETKLRLLSDIKGQTVAIIQSLQAPVNDYLIELLLLADAAKRAGAKQIIAVIPWLGYSKQDKVFSSGEPLSMAVVARAICSAPLHAILLMEVHSTKELEFFSLPVRHVSLIDMFVDEVKSQVNENSVVVSPDSGGDERSNEFAKRLGLPVIYIDKIRHPVTGDAEVNGISAPVNGKDCLMFDDLISTGSTVVADGGYLHRQGARSVTFCATHGIFARGFSSFDGKTVDKIIVSDSIPVLPTKSNLAPHFVKVISASKTIAEALK